MNGQDDFTRTVTVVQTGRIVFALTGPAPIAKVRVAIGSEDFIVNTDRGQSIGAVRYAPTRVGVWPLYVYATDVRGCEGSTGARREVTVRP